MRTTKTLTSHPTNMNQLSLSERLLRYLKHHPGEWINGGDLEKLCANAGYKGSTGSRQLRLLAELPEDGNLPLIQREERTNKGTGVKSVWYRWEGKEQNEDTAGRNERWFDQLLCSCQKPKVCTEHR